MPWEIPDEPRDFSVAEMMFRDRLNLSEDEFEEIVSQARARAFKVAGVTELELLDHAWQALEEAEATGTDFRDFAEDFGPRFADQWGGEDPSRLENIFRTNVLQGYSLGRFGQMSDPEVRQTRPYWKFIAIDPCPICAPYADLVLPADDPFWADHYPLLHFSCECTVITLSPEEAADEGIDTKAPTPDAQPIDGFGETPDLSTWDPDLEDYPRELLEIYEAKRAG